MKTGAFTTLCFSYTALINGVRSIFMSKIFSFIFILLLWQASAFSQFTDFHPELKWYTIKGKHVEVHFHAGAERTARIAAKIADEVWGPLTSLYHYDPGIVHFVIKDIDDYSNGATYFFDNKIEIWTSALNFDLRGAHNWLRNVITHEFTHMVQIQSAMKLNRQVPAMFLQVLNYEDERRPDILYGYPNFIVSYPIATVNVPSWFAEGTAQYNRKEFNYDNWDTHRDMVLRCYALNGNMLTWNEMGIFDKTSLGNESVYNAGFALTRYISQRYGEDKLREISQDLGKPFTFTMNEAIREAVGKSGIDVYNEWKNFVTKSYKKRSKAVLSNLVEGDKLINKGFGNFFPTYSPDGKRFAYISNKGQDYLGLSSAYIYDLKTKKSKIITSDVRSTLAWVPGKNKIIYAKISDDNPNWYNVHDLYVYDLDKNTEKRLTHDLRANQPSISHDGKHIVFLFEKDGTTNLGMVDINGKHFEQITKFRNGEQVYQPKFTKNDKQIIFDYSYAENRDIARIDTNGDHFEFLVKNNHDNRNAVLDKNNNLIYCSDSTGIFNIYKWNMKTGEKTQLTNVIGGAFMPSIDSDGNILYAGYTSSGFKIFKITPAEQSKVKKGESYVWVNDPPLGKDKPNGDILNFNLERLRHYNDYQIPKEKKEKYKGEFTKLTFFPFLRYDNYNTTNKFLEKLKPGVYVTSSDMLNRYSFFAGAAINARLERDLFFTFNYRNKLPLLFDLGVKPELSLEVYNISRKANTDVLFGADTIGTTVNYDAVVPTDVSYNLLEFDIAAKQRIFSRAQNLEFRYIFSRYSATLGSFLLPDGTLYPSTSDNYLIGSNFQLKYTFDGILPNIDMDINPVGTTLSLQYNYELNKFNPDGNYKVENGMLTPLYDNFDFHRLELNTNVHFALTRHTTLSARIRAGAIFGPTMPDFFDFYLGGLPGMREYPFYAISGNKLGWLKLTYRFPLFRNIDARAGQLYIDKIFFSLHGDLGNAWNGSFPAFDKFKKGAGAEIRIHMNSYYIFPTDLFFDASYGFDKVNRTFRGKDVSYGKEWRFYGGLLFGFDM